MMRWVKGDGETFDLRAFQTGKSRWICDFYSSYFYLIHVYIYWFTSFIIYFISFYYFTIYFNFLINFTVFLLQKLNPTLIKQNNV